MVRETLTPAVHWVEGVARIRRGDDPPVMRLVQAFVDGRMMESLMNPVDGKIGKCDKERVLKVDIEREGTSGGKVVQLAVSSHFSQKERSSQGRHHGHCAQRLPNFKPYLMAKEFGMLHGTFVEDQSEGEAGSGQVEQKTESPVTISISRTAIALVQTQIQD